MLLIDDERLRITGADGGTRFDSDEGLFHPITSVQGTLNLGPYTTGNGTPINVADSFFLGNCHAACTHVIGAMKFTLNNYAAGMAFDRWHTIMGGSAIWVLDGEAGFQQVVGSNQADIIQFVAYSFRVTAGQVFLDRRVAMGGTPAIYSVLIHQIQYKLKAGLFT